MTSTPIKNFMGGDSFEPNDPMIKLKICTLSYIFGEKTYYQEVNKKGAIGKKKEQTQNANKRDKQCQDIYENAKEYFLYPTRTFESRDDMFIRAVTDALSYDFKKTLEHAVVCRNEFKMRNTTAFILAIAANHSDRKTFNSKNPKFFRNILKECWKLPSDAIGLINAWKFLNGTKNKCPTFIVKRAFTEFLEVVKPYQQEKYRRDVIDMVRLARPPKEVLQKNPTLVILMKEGRLDLDDKDVKWETHRSNGLSWKETFEVMNKNIPHLAALRNIRGFCAEDPGIDIVKEYLENLLGGVEKGKEFPFRYITAYKEIQKCFENTDTQPSSDTNRKPVIIDSKYKDMILEYLEACLQKSIKNYPTLRGDVICLSDNSGSARRTFNSEYGTETIANIGNLSSLLTGICAEGRAVIGIFGDTLRLYEVDKSRSILEQYDIINSLGNTVGGATENGVFMFFKNALANPKEYRFDQWFCYSDMQVGHGGLYGCDPDIRNQGFLWGNNKHSQPYINIHKCIEEYRKKINPKFNTFMVQTAGYDNTVAPEALIRGATLSGWTGREAYYAQQYDLLWNQIDNLT